MPARSQLSHRKIHKALCFNFSFLNQGSAHLAVSVKRLLIVAPVVRWFIPGGTIMFSADFFLHGRNIFCKFTSSCTFPKAVALLLGYVQAPMNVRKVQEVFPIVSCTFGQTDVVQPLCES